MAWLRRRGCRSRDAADNARADAIGLVFESDPRHDQGPAVAPLFLTTEQP